MLETPSETDEDDRTLLCDDPSFTGGGREEGADFEEADSPTGGPPLEALSEETHALLSPQQCCEEDGHLGEFVIR